MAQAQVVNNTLYVPTFNGTLISINDCTPKLCSLDWADMRYIPSFAGNLAYLVIFALLLLAQLGLGFFYKMWTFVTLMSLGLLIEIIGYAGRLLLHDNVFKFGPFVMYLVCLTIGPAFLSACIYLCLSRIIIVYGPDIARFSPRVYTLVFIACDVASLILQAAGGGTTASAGAGTSLQQTGIDIMIAGLVCQVFSLALFMLLGLDFARCVRRAGRSARSASFASLREARIFSLFLLALAVATITIFVRCCYRVAELEDGFGGKVANNQPEFMALEGPMIFTAGLALTLCHPGIAFGGAEIWKETGFFKKAMSSRSSFERQEEVGMYQAYGGQSFAK